MRLFKKQQIKKIYEEDNVAEYQLGPFERGIARTIGNSMRRILLSSIPSYSVYAIKVKGAKHEFVALDNVSIDLPTIILHLKELAIKVNEKIITNNDDIKLFLTAKKGKVVASDIKCPTGVEIINKNLYIADVLKDNALEIEMLIRKDRGYESFSENMERVSTVNNYIAIDSIYSPIKKVSYWIEELTTSKKFQEEQLVLKVHTTGSVSCDEVISLGAKILIEHYKIFLSLDMNYADINVVAKKDEPKYSHILNLPIEHLNLNIRTYNSLKRANIRTIKDITLKTRDDLANMKNFGDKAYKDLLDALRIKNIDTSNLE